MSADLGLKLLAPTPGSRNLIKTISKTVKVDKSFEQDDAPKTKFVEAKSALNLLAEHKEKVSADKARKALIEKQLKEFPKLGRGIGSGNIH